MPDEPSFEVGDCIAISYCNLKYPSTQVATVIRSTRHSFVADFNDGSTPCRYFRKDGRWRNQFGYRVTVAIANSGNHSRKDGPRPALAAADANAIQKTTTGEAPPILSEPAGVILFDPGRGWYEVPCSCYRAPGLSKPPRDLFEAGSGPRQRSDPKE